MMTVSITRKSSKANWSWRSTPIFFGRDTLPLVGSISPVRIFIKVDLPAPFGPVIAYRRPAINVVVTSSNSTRAPYRIDILLIEIIALNCIVECALVSTRSRASRLFDFETLALFLPIGLDEALVLRERLRSLWGTTRPPVRLAQLKEGSIVVGRQPGCDLQMLDG